MVVSCGQIGMGNRRLFREGAKAVPEPPRRNPSPARATSFLLPSFDGSPFVDFE
jgi:hypothetical protein